MPTQVAGSATATFVASPAQLAQVLASNKSETTLASNCRFGPLGANDLNLTYYDLWYEPFKVAASTNTELRLRADAIVKTRGIGAPATDIELVFKFTPKGNTTAVGADVFIRGKDGATVRNPAAWLECVEGLYRKVAWQYTRL